MMHPQHPQNMNGMIGMQQQPPPQYLNQQVS